MKGMVRVVGFAVVSCVLVAGAESAQVSQESGLGRAALQKQSKETDGGVGKAGADVKPTVSADGPTEAGPLREQSQEAGGVKSALHAEGDRLSGAEDRAASPFVEKSGGKAAALQKAQVMVLGVFHMANPGRDIFNLKVDDVLTEKRQKEIAETVAALAKFRPTKIAIESDPGGKRPQLYQDYLEGKYTLTRNEIDQLGFRLAKELGHKQIYPIDVDGEFPFDKVQEFAKKNGKQAALDEWMAKIPKILEKDSETLKNGTISDLLLAMNQEQRVREDEEAYMDFAQFADGKEFPGPDLLAEWYRRNARIFSNIRSLISSPEERVLVIYGAGHLYWLQRNVLDSRDLELERFGEYAGKK